MLRLYAAAAASLLLLVGWRLTRRRVTRYLVMEVGGTSGNIGYAEACQGHY
jgi:hypothetical protein